MKKNIFHISLLVLLSSCGLILGISNPKKIDENKILTFNKKLGIGKYHIINSQRFKEVFQHLNTDATNGVLDNLSQPMQLIVFDNKFNNICHLVNCNIGGIPLKWNRYNSFDSVPVLPNNFIEPAHKITIDEINKIIEPNFSKTEWQIISEQYDYIYFIYYAKFTKGFTKPFIELIDQYKKKNDNEKILYIYVLTDNLIYDLVNG